MTAYHALPCLQCALKCTVNDHNYGHNMLSCGKWVMVEKLKPRSSFLSIVVFVETMKHENFVGGILPSSMIMKKRENTYAKMRDGKGSEKGWAFDGTVYETVGNRCHILYFYCFRLSIVLAIQ